MSAFWILMEQIELFVVYMLLGVVLVKTKVMNQQSLDVLSRFVVKMGLPMMVFINTTTGVTQETLYSSFIVPVVAFVMFLLLMLLLLLLARCFHLEGEHRNLFRAMGVFSNVGFMGIPVVTSMYPEKGMLYISLFTTLDQFLLWTVGVKFSSPIGGENRFRPKKLVNPVTVAIVVAMVMILLELPMPALLQTAFTKVGSTTTPLAMIYLGGTVACMDVKRYVLKKEYYGIVLAKMLVFPVLFYLLTGLFPIAGDVRMVLSLIASLPSMTSVVMMAGASGSDADYATGGVCVTTLYSIITMPIVCWILQLLAG